MRAMKILIYICNLAEMRRNIADIRFFARNFFVKTGDVGTKKTPLLKY